MTNISGKRVENQIGQQKNIQGQGYPRQSKKKFWIIGITLLTILLVGLGWLYYTTVYKQKVVKTACSDTSANGILNQAAENLSGNKLQQLKTIVEKIQKINNYEKDSNCLYIVTIYYINEGNAPSARKYFDLLDKMYNSNKPNEILTNKGGDLSFIKQRLEFVELQLKKSKENFVGTGARSEEKKQ